MTVKRYGSVLFDAGLIEMACGDYVTYSDYQKLVAENARLIALSKGWAIAVDDCYFNETGDIYTDSIDACNEELSTIAPATDSAIAELRAQGVDALALHMEFNGYSNEASGAREYAANLRARRKG